jgi:hypothetical protein
LLIYDLLSKLLNWSLFERAFKLLPVENVLRFNSSIISCEFSLNLYLLGNVIVFFAENLNPPSLFSADVNVKALFDSLPVCYTKELLL